MILILKLLQALQQKHIDKLMILGFFYYEQFEKVF